MTNEVEARTEQSAASKRATLDIFKSKRRAEREIEITINDETVSMLFRAIGSKRYDALVSKYPPTTEQKANEAVFNVNKFAPALLAEVCIEPSMTVAEWAEIWESPDWNRGEVLELFLAASQLCNRGFNIPFNENA